VAALVTLRGIEQMATTLRFQVKCWTCWTVQDVDLDEFEHGPRCEQCGACLGATVRIQGFERAPKRIA